ncbi:MAG: hypothetical protein ACP5VN_08925 [Acidobacteriota bacterium]
MRGAGCTRRWVLAAGAAVLAALVHVHEPLDLSRGPVLVGSNGAECPVCATMGGGLETPPAPILLPLVSGPALPLLPGAAAPLLEAPETPSPARAPPSAAQA